MTDSTSTTSLLGQGDVEAFFGSHDRVVVPWPTAPRRRREPRVPRGVAESLLMGPPYLEDIDPRSLHATQPWVLSVHARYYLTGRWERTGVPSAQVDELFNQYPLVHVDDAARTVLLGGHHRALVALLEGRPLRARVQRRRADAPTAITPLLLVGSEAASSRLSPRGTQVARDVDEAVAQVTGRRTALVRNADLAFDVLRSLGASDTDVSTRARIAGLLEPQPDPNPEVQA